MEVEDGLSAIIARIGDNTVTAFLKPFELCDRANRGKHLSEYVLGNLIADMGVVFFGYDERMNRQLRVYVLKRDDIIVLINDVRGDFMGSYLAKQAIRHDFLRFFVESGRYLETREANSALYR
jgi:hypothetical protein